MLPELLIAFDDPLLVPVVTSRLLVEALTRGRAATCPRGSGDHLTACVNARVAERREFVRIPLAREHRADDAFPCPTAQITDDIRQLDVHLSRHLLHLLNAGADRVHVITALAPVREHDANVGWRVKRVPEQAVSVELQQPLALLHIALSAGEILGVPRVHQDRRQVRGPPRSHQGNPIDAGRLHRDGGHPTVL
jgi:hypothetical protein